MQKLLQAGYCPRPWNALTHGAGMTPGIVEFTISPSQAVCKYLILLVNSRHPLQLTPPPHFHFPALTILACTWTPEKAILFSRMIVIILYVACLFLIISQNPLSLQEQAQALLYRATDGSLDVCGSFLPL